MKKILLYSLIALSLVSLAQSPFTAFRYKLQEDNFKDAESTLDSCSFLKYQEDSVLYYRGLLTLKKGKVKGAKIHAENLQRMYPNFYEVHYLNGLISFTQEDYGKSIEEFSVLLKQQPNHLKAQYNRSLAYGMLEDYKSAINDLNTCLQIDSTFALAYYSRAYWYEFTNKYADAIADYEKSIRLDPKNYDAYLGLAYIYNNQKENTKACEVLNRAINAGSVVAAELRANYCSDK